MSVLGPTPDPNRQFTPPAPNPIASASPTGSFIPNNPTTVSPGAAATLGSVGIPAQAAPDTSQNPTLAADPAYQAFMRASGLQRTTAEQNTQSQSEAIDRELALRRAQLGQQNVEALGGINNNMESRGIYRSGENESTQAKQRGLYGAADAAAVAAATGQKSALQQTLSQRLADLSQQQAEQALAASQRLAEQQNQATIAARYAGAGQLGSLTNPIGGAASGPIAKTAMSWVGEPYQWGGGHGKTGAAKSTTVDCSGLVQQVFGENGIAVTGTAADMQKKGTAVPSLAQARPGDLVFWGQPAHHVGIYIGNGQMIDAPHTGATVRIEPVTGFGSDFAGIRRVA